MGDIHASTMVAVLQYRGMACLSQIGASHTCLNTQTHNMWRRGQEDLIMVFLTIVQMSYFSVRLVFMTEKAKKWFATLGQLIRPMIPLTRERP